MTALAPDPDVVAPSITSILLVDDHELVTGALQLLLERLGGMVVTGVASTIATAVEQAARLQPDLIITDLCLPDGRIDAHVGELRAAAPGARVLIVTGAPSEDSFVACMRGQAAGYVSKSSPLLDVVSAAQRVIAGEAVFPSEYLPALLRRQQEPEPSEAVLTARETDVLQALARGRTTTEVAHDLYISVNTVRNHLAGAMAKLGKSSRLAAVCEAQRRGLIAPPAAAATLRGDG